ncbi:MAG: Nif3-like dinuclear metal center hexameric protein [bacterium]|nr:Nif3-like dinuclear metal center hexameric protein [Candidatus Limimorpha equi]
MTVKEILSCLTRVAPLSWQESYDNAGLQVGDENAEVSKALVALDVTEALVDEAVAKSCNLILSHHPLIFRGLKHLTPKSPIERAVMKAIKNDIAIISMHTNLDNSYLGVNRRLGEMLGLKNLHILQPMNGRLMKLVVFCPTDYAEKVRSAMFEAGAGCIGNYDSCSFNAAGQGSFRAGEETHPFVGEQGKLHFENEIRVETIVPDHLLNRVVSAMLKVHPYEEVAYDVYQLQNEFPLVGSGMIGEFETEMPETDFLNLVSETIGTPCLRHSALTGRMIKRVALCGGAGSFLLDDAKSDKADAFLSADMKYHDFFEPDGDILMVDGGHFETEQFTKELIRDLIRKNFSTFAAEIAETNANSVHYFVKSK